MNQPYHREIPFSIPYIDHRETDAVTAVLTGKWLTTGAKATEFEERIKSLTGARSAIAVSSGTAAMQVCLAALGAGPGDDVLTSAYTFASTALSVIHAGATPVFADIQPDTFNLDPQRVAEMINTQYRPGPNGLESIQSGRTLRGLMPVHFGGQAADMDELNAIAAQYNLFVIEDAAHAIGADYKNHPVGDSDNLVCFSFYSNKNLTTGEGGMIVTHRTDLEKKLRMHSLHGITKTATERYRTGLPFYDIACPGYKANLTDIQAALGVVQADKLPEITRLRNWAAQCYNKRLRHLSQLTLPTVKPWNLHAFHLYPILLDNSLKHRRDDIILGLREHGIYPSVHFIPVHFHSFFKTYLPAPPNLPVTNNLFEREISLPIFPEISDEDIDWVGTVLEKILTGL